MSRLKQNYSLYKRGKVWYYRTYSTDGKRSAGKSTGQVSKKLADQFCQDLFIRNSLNSYGIRFSDFARNFFSEDSLYCKDRTRPLASNTIKFYRYILRKYLMPYFGPIQMAEITYSDIRTFKVRMNQSGKSNALISYCIATLRIIMKAAYRDNLIIRNPCVDMEPIYKTGKFRDGLTKKEVISLIARIPSKYRAIIVVLALTGARMSEACGMSGADVMEEDGLYYIHLESQLHYDGTRSCLKTHRPRDLVIIPELVPLLLGLKKNRKGLYHDARKVISTFKDWDVRKLALHSLRHFFITDCKASGLNPQLVEQYVGHSLGGIENIYTNYHPVDYTPILLWQRKFYEEIKDLI